MHDVRFPDTREVVFYTRSDERRWSPLSLISTRRVLRERGKVLMLKSFSLDLLHCGVQSNQYFMDTVFQGHLPFVTILDGMNIFCVFWNKWCFKMSSKSWIRVIVNDRMCSIHPFVQTYQSRISLFEMFLKFRPCCAITKIHVPKWVLKTQTCGSW